MSVCVCSMLQSEWGIIMQWAAIVWMANKLFILSLMCSFPHDIYIFCYNILNGKCMSG